MPAYVGNHWMYCLGTDWIFPIQSGFFYLWRGKLADTNHLCTRWFKWFIHYQLLRKNPFFSGRLKIKRVALQPSKLQISHYKETITLAFAHSGKSALFLDTLKIKRTLYFSLITSSFSIDFKISASDSIDAMVRKLSRYISSKS